MYYELGGCAGALLEEDGAGAYDAVDDVLGVVADGDELEALVVAQAELVLQVVAELVEKHWVVVDAKREAEGSVLHEVDADVQFGEDGKDGLEVVFGDEAKVFGEDGEERLVVFEDVEGCEGLDGGEGTDDGTGCVGIEEGFDVELDILVLDGFNGFGVYDTGTVVGQFDGFVVGDLFYLDYKQNHTNLFLSFLFFDNFPKNLCLLFVCNL